MTKRTASALVCALVATGFQSSAVPPFRSSHSPLPFSPFAPSPSLSETLPKLAKFFTEGPLDDFRSYANDYYDCDRVLHQ